jgi:hypothetical protein
MYVVTCKFCGRSIFWLDDDESKHIAFEDDVVVLTKVGQKYADGYDEIKKATAEDVANKVKGFLCHFGRCEGRR